MSHDRSTLSPGIPEGARRASEGMPEAAARPDPEVVAVARRRRFSAGEKRVLLAEADRCRAAGTLGAFLRSKRIYSSMLSSWRKQLEAADRVTLAPKKRGPKPDPSARQIEQLKGGRYGKEIPRRKIRVFESVDARLTFDDMESLLALQG